MPGIQHWNITWHLLDGQMGQSGIAYTGQVGDESCLGQAGSGDCIVTGTVQQAYRLLLHVRARPQDTAFGLLDADPPGVLQPCWTLTLQACFNMSCHR